jgi:hypothetical protein
MYFMLKGAIMEIKDWRGYAIINAILWGIVLIMVFYPKTVFGGGFHYKDLNIQEQFFIAQEIKRSLVESKMKKVSAKKVSVKDLFKRLNKTSKKKVIKKPSKKVSSGDTTYKKILKYYLKYNKISYKQPQWAVKQTARAVVDAAKEFGLNPETLAAVVLKESGLRYKLHHRPVTVKVNGQRKRVQAIGLTGVIYEFHSSLKNIGIYSKKELWNIKQNVRACAHILVKYGARRNLPRALGRYYGKNNRSYARKVVRIKRAMRIGKVL